MRKAMIWVMAIMAIFTVAYHGEESASAVVNGVSWPHTPGTWPYVVVEDDSDDFPVITATYNWGAPLHHSTCATHPTAGCIKVTDVNYGDNGVTSQTVWSTKDNGTHFVNDVHVYLNSYYGNQRDYNYRLEAVEHELGHAMGLGHDAKGGVMQAGDDGQHTKIITYEYNEVKSIYGMD